MSVGVAAGGREVAVECRGVTIAHGRQPVVHAFDLAVQTGQTVALLGPSGSGKSTLLGAIAGFVPPMAGEIRLAGRLVDGPGVSLPPEARSVGVVFQNDALWPHLDVLATVAYPIVRRGIRRRAAEAEARAIMATLGIEHLAARRPAQLSGGEQQRTGLARALARAAGVYLLDEPTAHLDTALKATLQAEMAAHCGRSGAAVIFATHDVAEALAIADQVIVMRDGRAVQAGTPLDVYERPVDAWAARLTGVASVLRATPDGVLDAGGSGQVVVRPEWAELGGGVGDRMGRVLSVWFRGSHTDTELDTPFGALVVRTPGPPRVATGATVQWRLRRSCLIRS